MFLSVTSRLIKTPAAATVILGETVTLACQTDLGDSAELSSIVWRHLPTGFLGHDHDERQGHIFYHFNEVVENYKERFSVSSMPDGDTSLSIANVSFNDSGLYSCGEIISGNNTGDIKIANLTVLGKIF